MERPLGDGGFASVWLVRHRILHSRHALKLLDPQWLAHEKMRERFLAEGRILAQMRHPNLVPVTDVLFEYPERVGLVMEFVEGTPLDKRIERGVVPADEALGVIEGILLGIQHAHTRGIVHRDLKPPNVIVVDDGGVKRPVILDFGIAKVLDDTGVESAGGARTKMAARLGTPEYMSPEQVASSAQVDARSDIWSIGVILHELLTAMPPYVGATPDVIYTAILTRTYSPPAHLPAPLRALLERALQRDPGARFASATEMLDAVRAARASLGAEAAAPVRAPFTFSEPPSAEPARRTVADDVDGPPPTVARSGTTRQVAAATDTRSDTTRQVAPPEATEPGAPPARTPTAATEPAYPRQPTLAEGRGVLLGAVLGSTMVLIAICAGIGGLGLAWSAGWIGPGGRAARVDAPPVTATTAADPVQPAPPPVAAPEPAPPPVTPPAQPPPPAAPPTPDARPPAVTPPVTRPPAPNPPSSPPTTRPPTTNPPVTNPPVTNPPVTNPPVTNPPPSANDSKIVDDAWARYSGALRACTRTTGPDRASVWKIEVEIRPDGTVKRAVANGSPHDDALAACLVNTVKTKANFGTLSAPVKRVFSIQLPPKGAPPVRPPN